MGKLAGIISHDDNVTNQFKLTEGPRFINEPGTPPREGEINIINALLLEIKNDVRKSRSSEYRA